MNPDLWKWEFPKIPRNDVGIIVKTTIGDYAVLSRALQRQGFKCYVCELNDGKISYSEGGEPISIKSIECDGRTDLVLGKHISLCWRVVEMIDKQGKDT